MTHAKYHRTHETDAHSRVMSGVYASSGVFVRVSVSKKDRDVLWRIDWYGRLR